MQKIPTMFVRDESQHGHPVTNQIKPECQWVLDGAGVATAKFDGTNVKIEARQLLKRQKPASGDYDDASYIPCERANPADKWAFEAFDALTEQADGIYELCGPKVQGNPHRRESHILIPVVPPGPVVKGIDVRPADLSFDGLRHWLRNSEGEGIVFHHPDGRLAKIKRRDFGLEWPIKPAPAGTETP